MSPWQAWRLAVLALPALVSAASCAALIHALVRRPAKPIAYFLCFYALGTAHLLAKLLPPALLAGGFLGLDVAWRVGLALSRIRFIFLLLFLRSVRHSRAADAIGAAFGLLVLAAMAAPFFAYTRIPALMEAALTLYSVAYLAAALRFNERRPEARLGQAGRSAKGAAPKDQAAEGVVARSSLGLAKAYLLCSGFFLIGLALDFAEAIPSIGAYVSVFLVDFQPIYHACLGAAAALGSSHDRRRPAEAPGYPAPGAVLDAAFALPELSALPLSAREREIAGLMLRGLTNLEIAESLFIAESTVKKHVNNAFRKLGIQNRWELLKLGGGLRPKE